MIIQESYFKVNLYRDANLLVLMSTVELWRFISAIGIKFDFFYH